MPKPMLSRLIVQGCARRGSKRPVAARRARPADGAAAGIRRRTTGQRSDALSGRNDIDARVLARGRADFPGPSRSDPLIRGALERVVLCESLNRKLTAASPF